MGMGLGISMRKLSWRTSLVVIAGVALCLAVAAAVSSLPPVQERIGWRLSEARASIWYALFPPEEAVFTPDPTLVAMVQATLTAFAPTSSPTPEPSPVSPPTATLLPSPTATAIPAAIELTGVIHEYQKWNNCGPATLSMGLSFWGWEGDQLPVAAFTKPNPRDKNVMPYELANFVNGSPGCGHRPADRRPGSPQVADRRRLPGHPREGIRGLRLRGLDGPYAVVTGYDDARQRVMTQDSYISSNFPFAYDDLMKYWRDFNYVYLVVYPPDREAEVLRLLGPNADETAAYQAAAQRASDEIYQLTGRDQLFAWFNRGTNLAELQDYAGAAAAYDSYLLLDAQMAIDDPEHRPYRMLWYQTGPYKAYYGTGRYTELINLATVTLGAMSEPVLEESYYWRGLAREAVGDVPGAIEDLRTALEMHPGFEPALGQLRRLGVDV
jgi:hypothetical protein